MHWIVAEQNHAFAWEDNERGKFKEEYFPAIEIPMVAHIPWVERPFRILLAIYDEVCKGTTVRGLTTLVLLRLPGRVRII